GGQGQGQSGMKQGGQGQGGQGQGQSGMKQGGQGGDMMEGESDFSGEMNDSLFGEDTKSTKSRAGGRFDRQGGPQDGEEMGSPSMFPGEGQEEDFFDTKKGKAGSSQFGRGGATGRGSADEEEGGGMFDKKSSGRGGMNQGGKGGMGQGSSNFFEFDSESMFAQPKNQKIKTKDLVLPTIELDLEEDVDLLASFSELKDLDTKLKKLSSKSKLRDNGYAIGSGIEERCSAAEMDCTEILEDLLDVLENKKAKAKDLKKAISKAIKEAIAQYEDEYGDVEEESFDEEEF
ncbi:MAG: hypothetical protein UY05_C0045G0001, partial [Candidatus Peregrinibacteria bacterium GW2011_GWA2_47_7]